MTRSAQTSSQDSSAQTVSVLTDRAAGVGPRAKNTISTESILFAFSKRKRSIGGLSGKLITVVWSKAGNVSHGIIDPDDERSLDNIQCAISRGQFSEASNIQFDLMTDIASYKRAFLYLIATLVLPAILFGLAMAIWNVFDPSERLPWAAACGIKAFWEHCFLLICAISRRRKFGFAPSLPVGLI